MNRKEAYQLYLKSDHWKQLRAEAIRVHGSFCFHCRRTASLEVHHLIYRYPWETCTVADLQVLCHDCHQAEHGLTIPTVVRVERRRRNPNRIRAKESRKIRRYLAQQRNMERLERIKKQNYRHHKKGRPRWRNRGNSSN